MQALRTSTRITQDRDSCVRCTAVEVLTELTEDEDQVVIIALRACLQDRDSVVREAARRSLERKDKRRPCSVIAAVQASQLNDLD